MVEVTIKFVFPGEGMNVDGQVITADSELMGDEQLDHLSGYKDAREAYRARRANVRGSRQKAT
jgi:hypothetical protein